MDQSELVCESIVCFGKKYFQFDQKFRKLLENSNRNTETPIDVLAEVPALSEFLLRESSGIAGTSRHLPRLLSNFLRTFLKII